MINGGLWVAIYFFCQHQYHYFINNEDIVLMGNIFIVTLSVYAACFLLACYKRVCVVSLSAHVKLVFLFTA